MEKELLEDLKALNEELNNSAKGIHDDFTEFLKQVQIQEFVKFKLILNELTCAVKSKRKEATNTMYCELQLKFSVKV